MIGFFAGAAVLIGAGLGWWGAIAVVMGCLAVTLLRFRQNRLVSSVVVIVAAAVGAWRAEGTARTDFALPDASAYDTALVDSNPLRNGRYQHFAVQIEPAAGAAGSQATGHICMTSDPFPVVRLGDRVALTGRMRQVR